MWPNVSSFGQTVKTVKIEPGFRPAMKSNGGTKQANDLSGLFCRPRGESAFRCLVVNDESTIAEWADYVGATLTPIPGPGGTLEILSTLSSGTSTVFGDRTDGRLLVLSGPAQEQDGPFGLHLVRPGATDDWGTPSTIVADVRSPSTKAKAEGLAVLSVEGREARLLVLFEKPEQNAHEYSVSLPN